MHKIIDAHSHLGDIFAYEKNVIYKGDVPLPEGKYNPFIEYSKKGFVGPFLDPTKPEEIANVIEMTEAVSYANTLKKLSRELDEAQVDYVVMFPLAPYITFEDYRVAALVEPRIIPFTSADWRSRDAEKIGGQLLEDAKNGAKGLKIHPILQNISLRDPLVEEVCTIWATTGLPIVSHTGANAYYPEDSLEFATHTPEYGDVNDFIALVKKCPNIKFIAAHAGGLGGGEEDVLADALAGHVNLWVDTTFRNSDEMRKLVELFGEDKVLFGVDRPFGLSDCSVEAAFAAFGKGTPLSEKVMYRNIADLIGLSE